MVDSVFGNLDREATVAAMREYLKEWKAWKIKSLQTTPTVGSPDSDGQPHGSTYEPDKQMVQHANAEWEQQERIRSCQRIRTIGEDEEVMSDILYYRFIRRWSAAKTMLWVNDHYNIFIDDRGFRRLQKQALWEAALMCQDSSVRIPK